MEQQFEHLMIDIETMGNKPYSAILSIAAVEFDMQTGKTGRTFNQHINLQSCFDIGLNVNADTVMWWLEQSEKAKKMILQSDKIHIAEALQNFSNFLGSSTYHMWGNSASFDLGLLSNAYEKINLQTPWDFWNERCLRTLVFIDPLVKQNHVFEGVQHDGVTDCLNQIAYASKIYEKIVPNTFLIELEEKRLKWSLETFTEATALSSIAKLKEEVLEIESDVSNNIRTPEEFADALMALFDVAGRLTVPITVIEILNAFSLKLEVNISSEWIKQPDNTYKRIKK